MTVKTIIQEALYNNALGFEAAFKDDLRSRIALTIEAKMKGQDDDDESDDDESEEDESGEVCAPDQYTKS